MASLKYWLWLANLPGVGNIVKLALLDRFEEPDAVFYADREAYLHTEGITQEIADALENKSLDRANEVLGDCDRLGIRIITIRDSGYPARLRNIYDPPLLLYAQGRMPLFDEEVAVTMVGTRGASLYAQQPAWPRAGTPPPTGAPSGPGASPPPSSPGATTSSTPRKTASSTRTLPPGA